MWGIGSWNMALRYMNVRKPMVAGSFYPKDPGELRAVIRQHLDNARTTGPVPKALVLPHAGYIYSGPVAASGYKLLRQAIHETYRVVLLGPSHWAEFDGIALSSVDAFATPLGSVPLDKSVAESLSAFPSVVTLDKAHVREHSLEVHIPFLQEVLEHFYLVPLSVGKTDMETVGNVIDALWGGPDTIIIVSTDLSHYLSWEAAREIDGATARAVEELRGEDIEDWQACGSVPLRGLLHVARKRGLKMRSLDLRNSGDTAGSMDVVVGYGAFALEGH